MGAADGVPVGAAVGADDGEALGDAEGVPVGAGVGDAVGEALGVAVGVPVGDADGAPVGAELGEAVGAVGAKVGDSVGDLWISGKSSRFMALPSTSIPAKMPAAIAVEQTKTMSVMRRAL